MSESKLHTVTLHRVFDAPIDLVYRCWTEAAHVTKWMKCDAAVELTVDNWVPAVGTQFRTHMVQPGVFEATGTGQFTAVEPPHLLAYTQDADPKLGTPEMHVRIELREEEGKTALTLTHAGIPSEQLCGIITGGWTNSLGMLADTVAARAAA